MPYADPLSEEEIEAGLKRLGGWERDGDAIRRTITAGDFAAAIRLVDEVAAAAEAVDHHPDISVTRYRRVTFVLTTHAASAITRRDIELAAEIDRLAARIGGA
jgi:4a-hydroxytetrahydrobiopterin dehydratase